MSTDVVLCPMAQDNQTRNSDVMDPRINSGINSPDDLPLWTLLDPEFGVPGDVIFVIEDIEGVVSGEVWAHSNILALKSPVFKEMFYPKLEKETIAVMKTDRQMVKSASVKTFKKMLDDIYGKEVYWSDCSVVEGFQVMHLAVKYKLDGLQTKVVNYLRQFPVSNLDVLEAAVTAQELESIFPLASEALLQNCCTIFKDSFPTSEDFLEYVTQLSITYSELSLVALKLWGMINNQKKIVDKKVKLAQDYGNDFVKESQVKTSQDQSNDFVKEKQVETAQDHCNDSIKEKQVETIQDQGNESIKEYEVETVQDLRNDSVKERQVETAQDHCNDSVKEKEENVMNIQSKIDVTVVEPNLCLNCQKGTGHCLDGNPVSDIDVIGVGCTVIAVGPFWNTKGFPNRNGEMATVTGIFHHRNNRHFISVKWSKVHKDKKDSQYYLTPGGVGQNKPCFMVKCKRSEENEKCTNCRLLREYCLHGKYVLYIKPNSAQIGCKVISCGPYWAKEKIGKLATVVEAMSFGPDKLYPLNGLVKVMWDPVLSKDKTFSARDRGPILSEETYWLKAHVKHALGEAVFRFYCR